MTVKRTPALEMALNSALSERQAVASRQSLLMGGIDNKRPDAWCSYGYKPDLCFNDYYRLDIQGEVADYVIIMGYDEHWHGSKDPGSVASISYVSDGLDRTLQEVPANKVVNALPFYTILWKTEGTDVTDEYITMRNEADFMSKAGVSAEWDEVTCQNYAEWTSGSVNYQIWLEDAESIAVKLNMMTTKNIGGVAVWRLGYGTQAAWELINAYLQ